MMDQVVGPESRAIGAGLVCGWGSGFRSFCGDMSSFRTHRVSHRVSIFRCGFPPASGSLRLRSCAGQAPSLPRRTLAVCPLPRARWRRSMTPMAETWIRLLGPPRIESAGTAPRQPRGRKAWAVLAYLALQPDGISRARTAALLFPDAEDPLGALRWNLSELRRTLGADSITGDPLRLVLPAGWHCDALAGPAASGDAWTPARSTASCWRGSPSRTARSSSPGWRTSGTGSRTASCRCCTRRRWPRWPPARRTTPSSSPPWRCTGTPSTRTAPPS